MAIIAADLNFRLSTKVGAAGNSTAGTPAGSLGKYMSTTDLSATALNNLFDDVTGAENAASDVEYRCVFVHNDHASLSFQNAVVYMSAETAGGTNLAIAVDDLGPVSESSASAQADEVTNEDTAPTGAGAFSSPVTAGAGLSLGSIPAGQCRAVWVRRTAANSAALDNDGFTLAISGDTAA